jgi:phosphonate degradation associated HDIG domain protein
MALTTVGIVTLFEERACQQYGREAVSQLEHALQCAQLAELAGETDATIVAALLHDIGHLISGEKAGQTDDAHECDDLHQYIALPFLRGVLPDAVLEPIRLHVDAKRYLCGAESSYWDTLSPASKRSLELQGGPFQHEELAAFLAQPFAREAVRLRRYDDLAKVPDQETFALGYFAAKLHSFNLPQSLPKAGKSAN